jgi:hypothetical protein
MRRSRPSTRSALVAVVLALLLAAGDGLGLHACAHHDLTEGAGPATTHAPAAGDHAAHAGHPDDGSEPADHGTHGGPCNCLGVCPAGTGAPIAAGAGLVLHPTRAAGAAPVLDRSSRLPAARPPHFLPYALAPPARG